MTIFGKSANHVWVDEEDSGGDEFALDRNEAERIFLHYSKILSDKPYREDRDDVRREMREDENFIRYAPMIMSEFANDGADYINATIRVEAKHAIRNSKKLIWEIQEKRRLEKEREAQEMQAQMKDNPIFGMF